MIAVTEIKTMLYCPKCRRTYEEGTQRFCDNDGGRLLPAPSAHKIDSQSSGVFSNLLGIKTPEKDQDRRKSSAPRFIPLNKTEESNKKLTSFPSAGRIFQSEQFLKPKKESFEEIEELLLELDPMPTADEVESLLEFKPVPNKSEGLLEFDPVFEEQKSDEQKLQPRLVKPSEIASGTASVGDRKTNPLGRKAFNWENTSALIGQTIKGRYQIAKELAPDDEESVIYLADDKIVEGKKVVVRVFMNEDFADEFEEKIFAEERVSLSHLNHPNIASVFDSGELQEGNEFIVSEFVEGKSLAEMLQHTETFNSLRTARIVRQTSYALSEAHQNGILHRNLKPENIMLTVSEAGIEQVKLMNFGVSHGEITDSNLAFKAPEEIEKGISTFASDIYSLGVIAYQMLTGSLPFTAERHQALLKAQKGGLKNLPTNLREDVDSFTDQILEKALAFNPAERYPKARDFGDAFFNALTTVAVWKESDESEDETIDEIKQQREFVVVPSINKKETVTEEFQVNTDLFDTPSAERSLDDVAEVKSTEDLAWEKRSPEPPQTGNAWRGWLAIAGVVVLLLAFWGLSRVFLNRTNSPENVPSNQTNTPIAPADKPAENSLISSEPDIAPQPRIQETPPETVRFQNSREGLKEDLAKNFLGFEIFYPQNWTKNSTPNNFLDISNGQANNGTLVEQMIVTRYKSKGTMTLDSPDFPKLVEKSNQDLKSGLGDNYKVISEGETTIQNGRWKVYEVKFQSSGVNAKGENMMLWGRRLWLPVQSAGEQNGFVITMLATSLSDKVKSVDDVGLRGDLAGVLETFEPEQYR